MGNTIEYMKSKWGIVFRLVRIIPVFFIVSLVWIFFRSVSLKESFFIFSKIFSSFFSPGIFCRKIISAYAEMGFPTSEWVKILIAILILFVYDLSSELSGDVFRNMRSLNRVVRWAFYIFIGLLLIFFQPLKSGAGFIYFQF